MTQCIIDYTDAHRHEEQVDAGPTGCPPSGLRLSPHPPCMPLVNEDRLFDWVARLPGTLITWCWKRADEYGFVHSEWTTRECHLAAVVDLAVWQIAQVVDATSLVEQMSLSSAAISKRTTHTWSTP